MLEEIQMIDKINYSCPDQGKHSTAFESIVEILAQHDTHSISLIRWHSSATTIEGQALLASNNSCFWHAEPNIDGLEVSHFW